MRKSRRRVLIAAALALLGAGSLSGSTLAGVGVGVGVGDWRYNFAVGSPPTHHLLLEGGGKILLENGDTLLCNGC